MCRVGTWLTLSSLLLSASAARADWPQFRAHGAVAEQPVPVQFGPEQNLRWRTELPGYGSSSPIVVGDRVLVTCYLGYGFSEEDPGEQQNLARRLVCVDRNSGEILWQAELDVELREAKYMQFLALHGYSTNTPVSDGKHVWVFCGKSGVFCYDLEGSRKWRTRVGDRNHHWGSAASPVLVDDLVIVNAAIENYQVVALDRQTGREVWRRQNLISSWSTPLAITLPDGRRELIVSVKGRLVALDPATGDQRWECQTGVTYAATCPLYRDGMIYTAGDDPRRMLAIKAGGSGDVSETHIAWTCPGVGSSITSPVLAGDYLYVVDDRGTRACVRASDGEALSRQRLAGATFYASPVIAGDKLYAVSREAGIYVCGLGPEFPRIEHNPPLDDSVFNATPAADNGQLFLRSYRYLYCIGKGRAK